MKKRKSSLLFTAVLSVILSISIFAGCSKSAPKETELAFTSEPTTAPAETQESTVSVSEEEMALMKCKTAIEDIQSYETYTLKSANQFEGEDIINDTSDSFYFKDGEDWLQYTRIPESGILDGEPVWFSIIGYLCKDGTYFNTERDGYIDSELVFHGTETTADPELSPWFYTYRAPWLYSFDWDAQEVTFVSKLTAGAGESIRFQVHAPYYEDNESQDFADSYTAELYFDAEGRFEKAVVMYYATRSGSGQESYIRTETIQTTNAAEVAAIIDTWYENAVNGCGDETCTVCYGQEEKSA